ncbi:MAG: DNA-processing protein DprA [Firmicutes bacterium]|nr:DNA-processing protein DprA [Bacillota bacterium]
MRKMTLNQDSLAMLLLCTNLALHQNQVKVKPFTLREWNDLTKRLKQSTLGRPQAFLDTDLNEWKEVLHLSTEQAERVSMLLERAGQLGIELERLQNLGIWVTTRAEANYPRQLKKSLGQKTPVVLFYAGSLDILQTDGVCIVGSRKVDETGVFFTRKLAEKCAQEKLTVVSGGAAGVDSIAQEAALKTGGKVIAVLADTMEFRIMRREWRESVLSNRLLVLSTANPKAHFKPYTAMERNKYLYTLAKYAVVVSSAVNKGGTWAGANENLRAGWTPLFVRSEDGIPEGNKMLLQIGGLPINRLAWDSNITTLRDWFSQKDETYRQQSLFGEDVAVVREAEEELNKDIYETVWPIIAHVLKTPRKETELAEILNIRPVQLKDWLLRAITDGRVVKEKSLYSLSVRS